MTRERPKTMVEVGGRPLLSRIMQIYRDAGIKDLTVVRGYHKAAVDLPSVTYVDNDDYSITGELYSLLLALDGTDELGEHDLLVSYGDVLFRR